MTTETAIDNIDIDLTGVQLVPPILADGTIKQCMTGQVYVKPTTKGPRRINIPLTLEEPAFDQNGKEVQIGSKFTAGFLIDPSGGWDQKRANEELGRFKGAVLNTDNVDGPFGPLEAVSGKPVLVKFE